MGLLIGVGNTKPTFPYDYYYGVEWDITVSNPKPTRVGKMELHKELPLQNMMRNCILDDNGKVVTEVVTTPSNNGGAVVDPNQNAASSYTEKLDTFQAYWMDMTKSEDIVFNGDMINVTFKVKDTAPDGNYVIHLSDSQYSSEFANWDAKALVPSVTNGCITVGSATPEAQTATNASDFVLTADSVTAKQGDEVTVSFNIADNPGMVAFVLRFQYDCNALEIVDAEVGDDCAAALRTGLNH